MNSILEEDENINKNPELVIKRNRTFLDVGNRLQNGVVDHHQRNDDIISSNRQLKCVTSLVVNNPNLVLDNIDNDCEEIEIVMHTSPDFDSYAAAFLIEKLTSQNNFGFSNEAIEKFCEYTKKVDSATLQIIPDNLEEIYAVGYAIHHCERNRSAKIMDSIREARSIKVQALHDSVEELEKINELHEKEINAVYASRKKNIRERWFLLFNKVLTWLECNKDKTLEHNNIFINSKDFDEEIQFVKEDYKKYQTHKNSKKYFNEVRVMLPKAFEKNGKLYPVKGMVVSYIYNTSFYKNEIHDGLYFTNEPEYNIVLLKCWLRNDGYIFIVNPLYAKRKFFSDEVDIKFENIKPVPVEVTRVSISVDPDSVYSLRGLANLLEEEEKIYEYRLKENCLVDGQKFFKRDYDNYKNRRWLYDPKCTNDDPWYDGRNYQYTLIDSPRKGSLLSFKTIKNFALNYSFLNINVSSHIIKVVIPFEFKGDYKYFKKFIKKNFKIRHSLENGNLTDDNQTVITRTDPRIYFLNYINEYLYSDINTDDDSFHINFDIDEPDGNRSGMATFYYGTGCLYFSVKIKKGSTYQYMKLVKLIDELNKLKNEFSKKETVIYKLLEFVNAHDENKKSVLAGILSNKLTKLSSPKFYYSVNAIDNGFITQNEKFILYKMAYLKTLEAEEINDVILDKIQDKLIMKAGQNLSYAYSKDCGVMLYVDFKNIEKTDFKKFQNLNTSYSQHYFDIYLLTLHHRYTLLHMEGELAKYDKKISFGKLNKLRRRLMNFTTQGWFHQITDDEIGQEIYSKWQAVLECKSLYEEVLMQIEAVDSYRTSSRTKFVEIISFIFFPILFITQILGCEVLQIKPIGPEDGYSWKFLALSTILTSCTFFGLYVLLKLWEAKK